MSINLSQGDKHIGAIPALLPVISLKALHQGAANLGLTFASMGLGSLAGAVFILQPARNKLKPNEMTILGGITLAVVYVLMAVIRHPQLFLLVAALAGVAWTISASELWVAGQRVVTRLDQRPDERHTDNGVPGRHVVGRDCSGACSQPPWASNGHCFSRAH